MTAPVYPILDYISDDDGPPSVHSIESDHDDDQSTRIKSLKMKKEVNHSIFKKLDPDPYEKEGLFFS